VKPAAERMIRKEHPWIFESAIVKLSGEGQAGDLAIVYDQKKNKFLALGLYDPFSPIRIKVLQSREPANINTEWFQNKIEKAFSLRKPLLETDTNSYRLIYGENDGLPGFIADVYAQVLVVKLYSLIWLPYLKDILPALKETSRCETIVLRLSRALQKRPELLHGLQDGQVLEGELEEEEIIFREHGLLFSANVIRGHKTGYFLDHRHNRKRVGELAAGKSVLDVFAYAGGFSVHALAGGAREVVSLDISAQALEMARKNLALNQLPEDRHRLLVADAFEGLGDLSRGGQTFDLVIVDPPSFAKADSEREGAFRSYQRLCRLAIPLVKRGGILLMASCSSRIKADEFFALILSELEQSGRAFEELERNQHDVDHPIGFPEGAYLKSIYFFIE
jgi:23S rRNA (cytosine1962-C5)-methyltransferase